jgi:hypothetical protein
MSLRTKEDKPIFYSACPTLTGPNAGSLRVVSYRKDDILKAVSNVVSAPIPYLYWIMHDEYGLLPSCINRVLRGCDSDEVLLITETEWDSEKQVVTTPFEDDADKFLRGIDEAEFEFDISVLRQGPLDNTPSTPAAGTPQGTGISPTQAEYARRLGLKDDATFTTEATGHVSRVTNATAATNGANTFRSTTTADAKRSFREKCLERARAKASQIADHINNENQSDRGGSANSSSGKPASKGSAASTPKSSSAKLHDREKGGGAPA